jgi:hypothetical protein
LLVASSVLVASFVPVVLRHNLRPDGQRFEGGPSPRALPHPMTA